MQQAALSRTARASLKAATKNVPATRRGLAAPASGSFTYSVGEATGIKIASRDVTGPTTTLAVVARAGTRFEPAPGYTQALEGFAFKSTSRRSALRINREIELLGGEVSAHHSRENMVLTAKFLRGDLPYFAELLGEVLTETRYTEHELNEQVIEQIRLARVKLLANTHNLALNSAHATAFHRGLGNPLHPVDSTPLTKYLSSGANVGRFGSEAYAKNNIAVVANGAEQGEFSKWVGQFFTGATSSSNIGSTETQTKYYGGEERISHGSGNTVVLAFPGSSLPTGKFFKPEIEVLASLLGGQSSIKWSSGFSLLAKVAESNPGVNIATESLAYSDAGLLTITLTGKAEAIREATSAVVKTVKAVASGEISKEAFTKAKASAKFRILESGQNIYTGLETTGTGLITGSKAYQVDEIAKAIDGVQESSLKQVAKTLTEGKATVASVGDLYQLPYAEEIGLSV